MILIHSLTRFVRNSDSIFYASQYIIFEIGTKIVVSKLKLQFDFYLTLRPQNCCSYLNKWIILEIEKERESKILFFHTPVVKNRDERIAAKVKMLKLGARKINRKREKKEKGDLFLHTLLSLSSFCSTSLPSRRHLTT